MTQTTTIIPFTADHIEAAHGLSKAVSWPHRATDWGMLLELGQGVVAIERGAVIGTGLRCQFGPDLAVANMIIVDKAHQGKGLGRKLMESVLPSSGLCRLVATTEGRPLYHKLGFKEIGQILQVQGTLSKAPVPQHARAAGMQETDQIIAHETATFGGDRSRLARWMAANAKLVVTEGADGRVNGYAAVRVFGRGHVIGPVVAPNADIAKDLICAASQGLTGQFLRIDTDVRAGLSPWIETLGLAHVGGGIQMQRGQGPLPAPRYALFSQALG